MFTLKGSRPHPSVGVIGNFDVEIIRELSTIFPTIWESDCINNLAKSVSSAETDLVIISPDYSFQESQEIDYLLNTYVICFSGNIFLPGPADNSWIVLGQKPPTEHYAIPKLTLNLYSLLENDLPSIENAKDWPVIELKVHTWYQGCIPEHQQLKVLNDGALIFDPHTKSPFATIYTRLNSRLGLAWLPNRFFNMIPWIVLICSY